MWKMFGVTVKPENVAVLGIVVVLSAQDIRKRQLPTIILCLLIQMAAGWQLYKGEIGTVEWLLGAMVGILFLGMSKVTHEAIGYGDGLLIMALGIYLGIWNLFYVLMVAFGVSAVWAIIKLCTRKFCRKTRLPFVPCLAAGCFVYYICG